MQIIFTAATLVAPGGDVFVHDCNREVERRYSEHFLLRQNLLRQVGKLRHYRMAIPGATRTVVPPASMGA